MQVVRNAKQALMKKYPETSPIGVETAEAILDDLVREIEGRLKKEKEPVHDAAGKA